MRTLDARGLSCPEPVLLVQKSLSFDDSDLDVIVSNIASAENIRRFAMARGYDFALDIDEKEYLLHLRKA